MLLLGEGESLPSPPFCDSETAQRRHWHIFITPRSSAVIYWLCFKMNMHCRLRKFHIVPGRNEHREDCIRMARWCAAAADRLTLACQLFKTRFPRKIRLLFFAHKDKLTVKNLWRPIRLRCCFVYKKVKRGGEDALNAWTVTISPCTFPVSGAVSSLNEQRIYS